MIVVDSNVVAYLYLPGPSTAQAERLLRQHPDWAVPLLWRSEMRNILALYLRKQLVSLDEALRVQCQAEALLANGEHEVDSLDVLALAHASGCSAYDCEFIALARRLGTVLVTADTRLRLAFPQDTRALS